MSDLNVEKVDAKAYAEFLSDNPPDNPFSIPLFLETYREVFSCDVDFLFVVRNETPVAACAVFVGTRFSQRIVKLLPIRTYDGVCFRRLEGSKSQKQEYEKLLALQVLESYLAGNFSFYQMVFPPGFSDVRSFQWAGATVIPQYTYVVDMADYSEENYTKSLKEVLRAAERSGLSGSTCGIEELTILQKLSYERHGRHAPVDAGKLNRLLNAFNAAGLLKITCVRNTKGEILAGLARLQFGKGSYFYVSGTNAEGEKGASHLLYHEVLKSEKESGISFVDFCGANTPSINLFKSSFGPRLETHFRVWRANRLITRVASFFKRI
ncbi:MAG: GNAT family N-acetyltransferase [Bacteroidetes bacterium]|nr:GNAT family N-acetyltransferase [Bacteroidota bacterium]